MKKIANDLLTSEAKTPRFKMLPKSIKRETLVDQWSVHLISYYKDFKYINNQLQSHVKELKLCVMYCGCTFPIHKYSKQGKNSSCGNNAEKKKYRNKNYLNISPFGFNFLILNNFVLNCQNYLQIKGCAMDTKCTPGYANIFMGMFEERNISSCQNNV